MGREGGSGASIALMAEISAQLARTSLEDADAVIHGALALVAREHGFDSAQVRLLSDEGDRFEVTHQYEAPGYASPRGETDLSLYAPLIERYRRGEAIVVESMDLLPPEEREVRALLSGAGCRSACALPIVDGSQLLGRVAFASRRTREWPEPSTADLRVFAYMLGAALGRLRTDALLRVTERRRTEDRGALDEGKSRRARAERSREERGDEVAEAILGRSPALRCALESLNAVAPTSTTVLLVGESGVGKELFARALHARSRRAHAPLVRVNCASVPEALFESEFFGHVRGSFTGAHRDRVGRFELADGGTLFLDEVGEIPLAMQAKLLRVLQEGEFERLGDDRTRRIDVRIVAATNRDLEAHTRAERFRADLYYRLSVFPIEVPPLRERRDDILPLASHFLARSARDAGRPCLAFSDAQKAALVAYSWPGNVRELAHVIERAVILSPQPPLRLDLALSRAPEALPATRPPAKAILNDQELRGFERENIRAALERAGGRITGAKGAAELLGVKPSTLRGRMKALGIRRKP